MGLWQLGEWLGMLVEVVAVTVIARRLGVAIWPGFYRQLGVIPRLIVHISTLVPGVYGRRKEKRTSLVDVL